MNLGINLVGNPIEKDTVGPTENQISFEGVEETTQFDIDAWFATPELRRAKDKKMLELSIWWGQLLLDIGHFTPPKRVTFGPSITSDFSLSLLTNLDSTEENFTLIETSQSGGFVLCFTPEMCGYIEENGEKSSFIELIKRGKAHAFSDKYYYPLYVGTKVFIYSENIQIQIQFVDFQKISTHWFRYLDSYAPLLSLSIIIHLILTLLAIYTSF